MAYVNNAQLCGFIVGNGELAEYGGTPCLKFLLALNKPGAKKASYINCVAWGETALRLVDYCLKGVEIFVGGELETSAFVDSRGSNHKSTSLRIEKFSIVQGPKGASVEKPIPPG